jgi:hypothetical protein
MEKARSSLRALSQRIGRRGSFLLFLSLLDFIYAYGLAFPTARAVQNPTYEFLALIVPLYVWAALWLIVGALCLVYAFRQQDAVGYTAAMFLKGLFTVDRGALPGQWVHAARRAALVSRIRAW